jgi:hypothetical protein
MDNIFVITQKMRYYITIDVLGGTTKIEPSTTLDKDTPSYYILLISEIISLWKIYIVL